MIQVFGVSENFVSMMLEAGENGELRAFFLW